jgi:hypothetical protein
VTTYYGVSAPLASGKTTAAIEFAGRAAQHGEKFVIAQPSINLIKQSIQQFRERWPNVAARAIHSETSQNVVREISDHTKASAFGEVLFITHAALVQSLHWHRRSDWHLIIDEAPQVFYYAEFTLPTNYGVLLPALEIAPHNVRYSRLLPGNIGLLEEFADNRGRDQVNALFQEFAAKLASHKWDMFVLNEQWGRFQSGQVTDGKLLVFGFIDAAIFDGFATTTIMSANLERTVAYQHLVEHGHEFRVHKGITSKLRYSGHTNGNLLTIHYAIEDGNWSKHKRDKEIAIAGETCSVNDLIMSAALDLFGDDEFVWLANKDIEDQDPFGGRGVKLPHTPHGLNSFAHIHNAAVLAALNPSPALYAFLDEVAHLDSNEVRQAVYHESAYQAAGRISTRNLADRTPKRVVVADRAAAEALALLYPGASVMRLPFADLIPQSAKPGPKRIHASDADRVAAFRKQRKADLVAQLDQVNGIPGVTSLPYTLKVNSLRPDGKFGGSIFADIYSKYALDQGGSFSTGDFVAWLRDLHERVVAKSDAFLWSPAEFDANKAVDTCRGLANITGIWGVWLDCDGGDLGISEFAAMFPHLTMVIYNSTSSTLAAPRWRAVIPTTCAMSTDVHADIVAQIAKSLNRRGYFSRKQFEKRAAKGLGGKCHGFDTPKFAPSSLFYLPAQAAAGPGASFLLTFDGGMRRGIDPYRWIDKSIIDKRPEPQPVPDAAPTTSGSAPPSLVRKDPKLIRLVMAIEAEKQVNRPGNSQARVDTAINRWRQHHDGTGNHEFFVLAVSLDATGIGRAEIERSLHDEATFSHSRQSVRDRRASIPAIMRKLRCAA